MLIDLWHAFVEAALGTSALALMIGGPIGVYEWRKRR